MSDDLHRALPNSNENLFFSYNYLQAEQDLRLHNKIKVYGWLVNSTSKLYERIQRFLRWFVHFL